MVRIAACVVLIIGAAGQDLFLASRTNAVSCADLFNRKNLQQGDSSTTCNQVTDKTTCGSSYVSDSSGMFAACLWSGDECQADVKMRCTPKRGIGTMAVDEKCSDFAVLTNPWFYDWGKMPQHDYKSCAGQRDSGYVPMWWGQWGLDKDLWPGADVALGFNEPDHRDQANMNATYSAELWANFETKTKEFGIKRLGSPATSTPSVVDGNIPMQWYDDFFAACQGCKVDFLAVHMYKTTAASAKQTLEDLHNRYKLPIWITEFNAGGSWNHVDETGQVEYMKEMLPFLEETPYIERYAWFSTRNKLDRLALIDSTGKLTEVGVMYRDFPLNVGK